ncbi:MAG: hypothetical protein ACJ8IK_18180 [Burkholderiaceae bacterium]|jgi:hypothetical protein
MNNLEPRLLRLREIEARLAFAEYHIGEQRALCARLTRLGLDNSLAHSLLRSMEDSIAILQLRRADALRCLELGEGPQLPPKPAPQG